MNNIDSLDEILRYRQKYPDSRLIIDTNVLLLLLVGIFDENKISNCELMNNNGKNYKKDEYNLLVKILEYFCNKIIIAPQTLPEIYSLTNYNIKENFKEFLTKAIEKIKKCDEEHIPLKVILENKAVLEFGFTDISIFETAKKTKATILTDEFDLYNFCYGKIPIIKFSHLVATHILKATIPQ